MFTHHSALGRALRCGDAPRSLQAVLLLVLVLVLVAAITACGGEPDREAASADGAPGAWQEVPPLPRPVSNNAVVALETGSGLAVFSFLGMDSTKAWDGPVTWAFRWDVGSDGWRPVTDTPGPPRLASTARAVDGRVYLFGGYTVARDGSEVSEARVDVYDPEADAWSSAAPMPVPVDDAVSGVWRDSLVMLVSGWSNGDNVADVQLYDPAADSWGAATPIPGPPVFGHAGGVVGDAIVYVDGVRVREEGNPRFAPAPGSWRGEIDPEEPTRIDWERIADHPGPPLYRAAAGTVGNRLILTGGTDTPYNYDGHGYDGVPAEPLDGVLAWRPGEGWRRLAALPRPSMDHRTLGVVGSRLYLAGGMGPGRTVTSRAVTARVPSLLEGAPRP